MQLLYLLLGIILLGDDVLVVLLSPSLQQHHHLVHQLQQLVLAAVVYPHLLYELVSDELVENLQSSLQHFPDLRLPRLHLRGMVLHPEPLEVLVVDEELVELLSLELQLVLSVLVQRLFVGDRVVLSLEERFESHHNGLEVDIKLFSPVSIVSVASLSLHLPANNEIFHIPFHFSQNFSFTLTFHGESLDHMLVESCPCSFCDNFNYLKISLSEM